MAPEKEEKRNNIKSHH